MWTCVVKVFDDDFTLLNKRAKAFIDRHNLPITDKDRQYFTPDGTVDLYGWYTTLEAWLDLNSYNHNYPTRYYKALWYKILRRTIGVNTITSHAYGYWGYHSKY